MRWWKGGCSARRRDVNLCRDRRNGEGRNERGEVGRGKVCRFRHGDGTRRKGAVVGMFFVDLSHGRRLIGQAEGVVGTSRGTRTGAQSH